ncbi:tachylectin-related carbohydrate-binding protein [Pseudactinotalea sp. Z1732]|uniref:tachylectin-related carbohydrate-binding protein n=1 Tax=Pseudactinotalea sp. Z1732 TaxID=3413026 RepID=UPI003C7E47D2
MNRNETMPEGDDVYVTIASAIPYVNYVVTAYKIVEGIYNFGRESDTDEAIRLLDERVGLLERDVAALDDRLSDLEVRVAQGENRARIRTIREHHLSFAGWARDLRGHPEQTGSIAGKSLDRLRAMYGDEDLWLWSDIQRKPEDAPDTWRPAEPEFKGVPLPTFAVGAMLWALSTHVRLAAGEPAASARAGADEVLGWVATRRDWIPHQTPARSLAERFRTAINVEVVVSTKYVTASGHCEYAFVAVNRIDRTRRGIRNVRLYVGPATNTMCTVDPRIADQDEALLEDGFAQLKTQRVIEEAATRLRDRGTLADPYVGRFPDWTAHRLVLYGIEPSGVLRRYQFDTTTALDEAPVVTPVGEVVGTGWQHFTDVLGTHTNVVYAFSGDGAIDWYRHDDLDRGPAGWTGPRRLLEPCGSTLFQHHSTANAGGGRFFITTTYVDDVRIKRSLELLVHTDPANGTKGLRTDRIVRNWRRYPTTFGGGSGVLYGIDDDGDLYWHRHQTGAQQGRQWEGPVKIGHGWNVFTRVFAFGHGFIAGLYPSGEMLLYHFRQWQHGPRGSRPLWNGPITVPGTHWRGFKTMVPMAGDAPPAVQ